MVRNLHLVPGHPDQETVTTVLRLLAEVMDGNVTGLAYVAIKRGGEYSGDVAGRLRGMPIYTLGLLKALEKTVTQLIP